MNYLDIVLILPLILAAFHGFRKGLVIELFSIAAIALGIYGAMKFSDWAGEWLSGLLGPDIPYLQLLSFAVTFIGIVAIVYTLGKFLEKLLNIMALSLVNKTSGALLGIAKVALIVSVLLLIADTADVKTNYINNELKSGSMLYYPLKSIAGVVIPSFEL